MRMTGRNALRGFPLLAFLATVLLSTSACSSGVEDGEAAKGEESEEVEAAAEGAEGGTGRVTLTEPAFRNAGIEVTELRGGSSAAISGVGVPGQVEFSPERVALISPRTSGRIERLAAVVGDRVRAGQAVAYLLSPAFLTAQNDFIQAARRADLLKGTADEQGARALEAAAQRRLQLLGVADGLIERLRAGGEPQSLLPIVAPFSGSIVEAEALAGAAVESGTPIFKIADLSVVDVAANAPEQTLPHLRIGQAVTVRFAAYPDLRLTGRIERLLDAVDPQTRTVEAIIEVPNRNQALRPGMFATVDLQVPVAAPESGIVLTLPDDAVIADGQTRYVFVEVGPRTYERREVTVEPLGSESGRVAVRSGLAAGERVVTRGAFTLKSELGKAAFGDDD